MINKALSYRLALHSPAEEINYNKSLSWGTAIQSDNSGYRYWLNRHANFATRKPIDDTYIIVSHKGHSNRGSD